MHANIEIFGEFRGLSKAALLPINPKRYTELSTDVDNKGETLKVGLFMNSSLVTSG